MKLRTFFIFFIILGTAKNSISQFARFSSTTKNEFQDAEKRKNNKVHKITSFRYPDSSSYSNLSNGRINYIHYYDDRGNMITEYSTKEDNDSLYISQRNSFDDFHRRIQMINYYEDGDVTTKHNATFKDSIILLEEAYLDFVNFDYYLQSYKNGNLIYQITKKNKITIDSSHYFLNENGQQKLMKKYSNKKLILTIEYEHLTKLDYIERIYETDGRLRLKRYWKYDNSGNLVARVEYDSKEKISTRYYYKYNCTGNEIESGVYKSDERLLFRDINKWNENNLTQITSFDKNNNIVSIDRNYFDKNGFKYLTTISNYNDEKIAETTYIYYKIEIKK